MNDSKLPTVVNSWNLFPWLEPQEKAIDTLTAFIRDAEHELLSVVTALRAHIDLLYEEQVLNEQNVDRFSIVNQTIDRLITDGDVLASVSKLAQTPRTNQKQKLEELMQEIAVETRSAFSSKEVSLSCEIAAGTTLIGNAAPLKLMITGMLLAFLHKCHRLDTVRIVGVTNKRRVFLSFNTGLESGECVFKPWQLGELRLSPMNGDGIQLSAVDAMARLHHGLLAVRTLPNYRQEYRLTFRV
jgi:light-regulated signal transduction histidine kinase (bacteriophytochrome)